MKNNKQWQSIQLCIDMSLLLSCVSPEGREGGSDQIKFKGYIRMPPDLEPMARIFCTGSKAKEVGW